MNVEAKDMERVIKREIKSECILYILNTWRSTQKLKERINSQGCTTDPFCNIQSNSPPFSSIRDNRDNSRDSSRNRDNSRDNNSNRDNRDSTTKRLRKHNTHQLANLIASDSSHRYHVYLRGVRHDTVFYDNQDRVYFLIMLDQAVRNYGASIFAFILMDNHLHIQIETDRLSILMKDLLARYSRWYNRKYGWDGSVFRRPFGRSKIYSDLHAIDNLLYILGNAFREQICPIPSEYLWTSYNCHPQICALKKKVSKNDISEVIKIDTSLMVDKFMNIAQLDYAILNYVPKRYFNNKSSTVATVDPSNASNVTTANSAKKQKTENTFRPRTPDYIIINFLNELLDGRNLLVLSAKEKELIIRKLRYEKQASFRQIANSLKVSVGMVKEICGCG